MIRDNDYTYYQNNVKPKPDTEGKKGFVCKICGYIYEGMYFRMTSSARSANTAQLTLSRSSNPDRNSIAESSKRHIPGL